MTDKKAEFDSSQDNRVYLSNLVLAPEALYVFWALENINFEANQQGVGIKFPHNITYAQK